MSTLLRQYGADYVDHTDYPIGGGLGYKNTITQGDADYVCDTAAELDSALAAASSGDIIYIPDGVIITYTTQKELVVPAGVTLASCRGVNGAQGASLKVTYTSTSSSFPDFITLGAGARITGLMLVGNNLDIDSTNQVKYTGVKADADGCLVDNCRISSFPYAGVVFDSGSGRSGTCRCCYILYCRKAGYGFGVQVGNGHTVLVEHCTFSTCQWAVSCVRGTPVANYEVRYCVFNGSIETGACQVEGGTDVSDCDVPAGGDIYIHHNTFRSAYDITAQIKGIPSVEAECNGNWVYGSENQFQQVFSHATGSIIGQTYDSTYITGQEFINVDIDDNWYGTTTPPQQTSGDPFEPPVQPEDTPLAVNNVDLTVMCPGQNVLFVKFPTGTDLSAFASGNLVHLQVETDPKKYVYWGTIVDKETE